MEQPEEWRDITGPWAGCEGRYEVSSKGRVRSLLRTRNDGPLIRVLSRNPATGYLQVCLSTSLGVQTATVHGLVAWAFCGPRPADLEVRHLDGNKLNNAPSNLAYGTRSENAQDAIRHGTNYAKRKTECPRSHPYSDDNTINICEGRARRCRTCHREDRNRRTASRRRAGLTSRGRPRIYSEDQAYARSS